jgi:FkbM family methyltransferase
MKPSPWRERLRRLIPFNILSRRRYLRFKRLAGECAALQKSDNILRLIQACPEGSRELFVKQLLKSRSQQLQDLFVLSELGAKHGGFFVEFGAADGREISNSWMLEQDLGWRGILAEPARGWHAKLRANRPLAIIETDCVWSSTGQTLTFAETENQDLSTVEIFRESDLWGEARARHVSYPVRTISLLDLMERHHAPTAPDYLSIDTEGSELEILSTFDFTRYPFKVITCEHNHGPHRDAIRRLLETAGYVRRYPEISLFDDWYVRR